MSVTLYPFPAYSYPDTGTRIGDLPVTREGVRLVPDHALTATDAPAFVEIRVTARADGKQSRGICGLLPAAAFLDGSIRFHEKTRVDRLQRQETAVLADQGALGKPILLTIPSLASLWQQTRITACEGEYRLTFTGQDNQYDLLNLPSLSIDGDSYTNQPLSLDDLLGPLVIADGHHRAETHARLAAKGHDCCAMIPVCIIGGDELTIGTFVRVIDDVREEKTILDALTERFTVTPLSEPLVPTKPGEWLLSLDNNYYRLHRLSEANDDLDSVWLDQQVLPQIFGITDTRTAPAISFAPASAPENGRTELPHLPGKVQLLGFPLPIDDFFAEVTDERCLPPKSTLFQPRVPSGLVVWRGDLG